MRVLPLSVDQQHAARGSFVQDRIDNHHRVGAIGEQSD
jgi:hypothetical protein